MTGIINFERAIDTQRGYFPSMRTKLLEGISDNEMSIANENVFNFYSKTSKTLPALIIVEELPDPPSQSG